MPSPFHWTTDVVDLSSGHRTTVNRIAVRPGPGNSIQSLPKKAEKMPRRSPL